MAAFTVRVELHNNPTAADYATLHEAMEAEGFSRTITDSDGTVYDLPNAEYNYFGDLTKFQVSNKARRAAAKTGNEHSVLVTKSDGRTWWNLKRHQPSRSLFQGSRR